MVQALLNGSFENGWNDIPAGSTINQEPDSWVLTWKGVGQPLDSSGAFAGDELPVFEIAQTIPECVHKHMDQLPPDEQPGGEHALILDGVYTYKVFSSVNPFGITLTQQVPANGVATLTVPVQVHHHGDGSYGACAVKVELVGVESVNTGWLTFHGGINEFEWVSPTVSTNTNGSAGVVVTLESRALGGIDFFIDNLVLTEAGETEPPPVVPPTDYDGPVITTGSKIFTAHTIGEGGTIEMLQEGRAVGVTSPTVKVFLSMGASDDIHDASPDTIIVGRVDKGWNGDSIEGVNLSGDLLVEAQRIMNLAMPVWAQFPNVRYWEILNEEDPVGVDGHRRMGIFQSHCIDIADANGYKLALFSYSLGVPEWEEWEAIVATGVFAKAKTGGHALALHEYSYPMDTGFGEALPGQPAYPNRGILACRYRWLYEDFLKPLNQVVPLFITEAQIALPDFPTLITPEAWLDELAWYDERLAEDYYVVGAHLFTLSSVPGWTNFNWVEWRSHLVGYALSVKDRRNALAPIIEEPVDPPLPPGECTPRFPYARTYILIPPRHGSEWVGPLLEKIWNERRFTIGCSADDGGWGPGTESRTVLALNPDAWDGDLQAFFDEWYPGVLYFPIHADTPEEFAQAVYDYYNPPTGFPPVWDDDITYDLPRRTDCSLFPDGTWPQRTLIQIDGVTAHHVGSDATPLQVATAYLQKDGCRPSIPYTIWIEKDGTILKCNPLEDAGLHDNTSGYTTVNTHLSVGLAGALHIDYPTEAQYNALVKVIFWCVDNPEMNVIRERVKGHMDYISTQCPGWKEGSNTGADRWKCELYGRLGWDIDGCEVAPPPSGGNTRGVHAHASTSPRLTTSQIIDLVAPMNLSHYKILDEGSPANVELALALMANDIEPVVRLYQAGQFPGRNTRIPYIGNMLATGATLIEIGNEPNLPVEWVDAYRPMVDWHNTEIVNAVAQSWLLDARQVISMGGRPGLYALAPTDRGGVNPQFSDVMWFEGITNWLRANALSELRGWLNDWIVWLPVHSGRFDKPLDFNPFQATYRDSMCMLGYNIHQQILSDKFGVSDVLTIGTEGGCYSPESLVRMQFSPIYNEAGWGTAVVEMHNFLNARGDIAAVCSWILGVSDDPTWDEDAWIRRDGSWRSPMTAMRS